MHVVRLRELALALALALAALAVATPRPADAAFPWPPCDGCGDVNDYKDYMRTDKVTPPVHPSEMGTYDFIGSSIVNPALPATPEELGGVSGMSIDLAWQLTTGRPDVTVAHLDSGILYDDENRKKAALNQAELPLPEGSASYDANSDGIFNIDDYASDSRVSDVDGNGVLDPRDLILTFSDGVDDDANGYVDDICGWDVHEHDNDPFDDVAYGHGTGESKDSSAETDNGHGWGVSPNGMFVPIKVSDSFIGDANDFGAGVAYAVDRGVSVISEALGTLNNTELARKAVDYAWSRGVPMVLSAADEQSYHHNYPAAYAHGFWANSVRPKDGTMVTDSTNLLLNGCTNYGGRADVAIASSACSSEATGRAAGIFSLMLAHARNQVERGRISNHPVTGTALSPDEIYALMRMNADDIDFSQVSNVLTPAPILKTLFPDLTNVRFPTQEGWDKYFGYGRANVRATLDAIDSNTIPPEAVIDQPAWFANVDPTVVPNLDITGSVAAWREDNDATFTVDWACGVDPLPADFEAIGHKINDVDLGGSALSDSVLASLDTAAAASECGFGSLVLPRQDEDDFDESYAVTVRVTVEDKRGNVTEVRRNFTLHHDSTAMAGFPRKVGVSGDSAPLLHDMDGDGKQEIVFGTADGRVHAMAADGSEIAGWPVTTQPMQLADSEAFSPSNLGKDYYSSVLAGVAIGDLDGDGSDEVVAADLDGKVYAFRSDGSAKAGFPVSLDPAYSDPSIRNEANRLDYGVIASPTLADLDGDGTLEVIVAAMDRHLYVWNSDGSPRSGFPVLIVDQAKVAAVDPTTHQVTWAVNGSGQPTGSIGTKLVGSPSVGDLNGDGRPEIVLGSNEEYYRDETANFYLNNATFGLLATSLDLPNSRAYAVSSLGNNDPLVATNPSGPFLPGWPVKIGLLIRDLLPTVGHGINSAPVLADVNDDGTDEVFVNGNQGPAYLLKGDGTSYFGAQSGKYKTFNAQLSAAANPGASSTDFPLTFGLLGGGAAGDLMGNGVLDFALPSAGAHQLLDNQGPDLQGPGDHQVMAWSADGKSLPNFPARIEDMQFLASPAIMDVSGDGKPEVVEGSGGYYMHAFDAEGGEPVGWPKFTGGWSVGSATGGDLDGDGSLDVVAITREGNLYAWSTPAAVESDAASPVQWASVGRDAQRTGSLSSGVATGPGACRKSYRAMIEKASAKLSASPGSDSVQASGYVRMRGASINPATETVRISIGSPEAAWAADITPGAWKANSTGTSFQYSAKGNGIQKVKLQLKNGVWSWQVKAAGFTSQISDARIFVKFRVGSTCFERARSCDAAPGKLSCKKPA